MQTYKQGLLQRRRMLQPRLLRGRRQQMRAVQIKTDGPSARRHATFATHLVSWRSRIRMHCTPTQGGNDHVDRAFRCQTISFFGDSRFCLVHRTHAGNGQLCRPSHIIIVVSGLFIKIATNSILTVAPVCRYPCPVRLPQLQGTILSGVYAEVQCNRPQLRHGSSPIRVYSLSAIMSRPEMLAYSYITNLAPAAPI